MWLFHLPHPLVSVLSDQCLGMASKIMVYFGWASFFIPIVLFIFLSSWLFNLTINKYNESVCENFDSVKHEIMNNDNFT